MQIARRLRAMIVNLTETLPAQRHSALRKELELLDRTIEKLYVLREDLKLASIPDLQGLGDDSKVLGIVDASLRVSFFTVLYRANPQL
jgi:hypothetical protein